MNYCYIYWGTDYRGPTVYGGTRVIRDAWYHTRRINPKGNLIKDPVSINSKKLTPRSQRQGVNSNKSTPRNQTQEVNFKESTPRSQLQEINSRKSTPFHQSVRVCKGKSIFMMDEENNHAVQVEIELNELKRTRTNLKSKFTRFVTYINSPANQNKFSEIKTRLQKVENAVDEFEALQNKIDILIDETEPGTELTDFENIFYPAISKAREMLINYELTLTPTTTYTQPITQNGQNQMHVQGQTSIRLPKLDLPSFNGAYQDWLNFYDSFKALIHDNGKLADVQKLQYLRSCLKDEAAKVISSLETSSANYNVAWNLLNDRYDNHRIIIQNHIKTLMELPSFNKESAVNIRQLIDNFQMHLRALSALNESVAHWDSILIYVLTSKLDRNTHREWEKSLTGKTMPKLETLLQFLRNRYQILEASTFDTVNKTQPNSSQSNNNSKKQSLSVTHSKDFCHFCKGEHKSFGCEKFQAMSISERRNAVQSAGLCFNCLRKGHRSSECKLSHCKKCNRKHNTLLHTEENPKSDTPSQNLQICVQPQCETNNSPTQNLQVRVQSQVLLSTAVVYLHDKNNKQFKARVVLDSGSQSNFITEKFAEILNLDRREINIPVEGLNQLETKIKQSVSTQVKSMQTEFAAKLEFLVIPRICNSLPLEYINRNQIEIQKNIKLADPEFHIPKEVDALLGAEIFYDLISVGQIKLSKQSAVLQKTKLGWVLAGKIGQAVQNKRTHCHLSLENIGNQIKLLWELDEFPPKKFLSPEESEVEKHFKENTKRDRDGKYTVKLPVNEKINKLGSSYTIAERQFLALERKFESNKELKNEYCKFMREYEELGHMKRVTVDKIPDDGYFLPHHAVLRADSSTTCCRVVYNGSSKTKNGLSLNDALKVGPTVQQPLIAILIRSRTHTILLSADIEKMYRMINIDEDDRKFHRIIWRDDPSKELAIYELTTVTYGTASAPYLATRVLQELAENEKENFPDASEIIKRDFFVDDLFTGAKNQNEAIALRDELIELLKLGGFKLRKWCSNDLELISSLPDDLINIKLFSDPSLSIKTLGIQWNPRTDQLTYTISNILNYTRITKRSMLSQIAQLLYDLIGLLGPIIIKAKIFMQRLWQLKCDWDESVPPEIHTDWQNYRQDLNCLNDVTFQRLVVVDDATNVQLHGFCDASEAAYGACIYVRSQNAKNEIYVNLLCSKTRVAPLKSITIPRLELCSAFLLANLLNFVKSILCLKIDAVHLWSDSTITLQWINTEPYLLKTFVANRVSQIREFTDPLDWKHVPTEQNPADFISRGQMPSEFIQNAMWITGPSWLGSSEEHWPCSPFNKNKVKSRKEKVELKNSETKVNMTHLSIEETQLAMKKILSLLQKQFFLREIKSLTNDESLHRSSSLTSLNPFLDKDGLLRVGGRLKNSTLSYNERYPIILPKSHHITILIIRFEHEINYHSGSQATLNAVRSNYWPINGMSTVKSVIKKCIICLRAKPTNQNYLMGNLPKERITQSRPFIVTGVDYCGPFFIKEKKHRNRGKVKAYISIFVCFATKACHIELVSDLTTETFIGCLKRFFARRGKSSTIFSDNGTNFVGANNELTKTLRELLNSENHNEQVLTFLENQGINWKFSPPNSPHFGGLWEAAVKSFKYLFIRTIGERLFSFEELSTFTAEIEAILNSRPITPLSSDPNDLRSLSPSHFLIGDSLMSVPEHDLSDIPENRLSNWQNIQRLKQCFWKRWYKEYLNQLNVRCKWQQSKEENPEIGTMVILKEDNIPPLRWHLGRIIEIHPGDDSIVRVVTVRTTTGTYKRSVKRIVPLPIN
ncbi:uncharacterized protein LOC122501086 [Leptopilina heterotoma]|uniref:uncharacterized protein LOC122501086 n=1 Tax=Leptopilina heterotoma TaxID=63436 RepID=UPI001CA925EF|nr:uncharacterized protein LOC122501086 [Leptopilina heterotoma]